MTTFELTEVRDFATDLDARWDRCGNGEGLECATLDSSLRHFATLCCEFCEGVRSWGRAVFGGHVAFDPEVQKLWIEEGNRLFDRAEEMYVFGQTAEPGCYALEGVNASAPRYGRSNNCSRVG